MRTSWLWSCVALVGVVGCVDPADVDEDELELAIDESEALVYQDPQPQLLAGYRLDGDLDDWGPLDVDLANRGATLSTDRRGGYGRAMRVTNTDYLVTTAEEPFDRSTLTIAMWFRQAALPPNTILAQCDDAVLVSKYNFWAPSSDASTNAFELSLTRCSGNYETLEFEFTNAQGGTSKTTHPFTQSIVNKWTHVAVSRASGVVKLYVNGKLVRTVSNAGVASYNNRKVTIGGTACWSPNGDYWGFNGDIDDVRFFSNQLTDAQVAALAVY